MSIKIAVSVHRFKVHRSKLVLIVGIYNLAAQLFYDRVPTYLTVSDFIEFASGLVNQ